MSAESDGIILHISNAEFWTGIGTLAIILITYVIRLERWRMTVLTLKKHEEICKNNQNKLEKDLHDIKGLLKDQNSSAVTHREIVRDQLTAIGLRVAKMDGQMEARENERGRRLLGSIAEGRGG